MFFSNLANVNPLRLLAEVAQSGGEAAGDAAADAAQGGVLGMIISFAPILLIGVVFYFMLIRPQRKKDKQVKDMLGNLKVGDRVTTIGGIHGTVFQIKDDNLVLTVGADKVKLVFARWGIRSVDDVSISNDQETLV